MEHAGPLLVLAVILLAGLSFGSVVRRLRVPGVTGQILAGVLLGSAGLGVFPRSTVDALRPLTHFGLGLMAVTVGAHLNFRRLRNAGRRLALLVVLEATLVPSIVTLGLVFLPGVDFNAALLLGTIAVSTAPATILAIVRETRARGVLVKTLFPGVALNNLVCIVLFELAHAAARVNLLSAHYAGTELLVAPLRELATSSFLGVAAALAMRVATRLVARPELLATGGFAAILLTSGLSSFIGTSPLLACLFLGIAQTNLTRGRDKVLDFAFKNFEPAILAIFFTLAGSELTLEHASHAGLVAAAFFVLRFTGKFGSARLAMRLAGATRRVQDNLGLAMIPQAGVAVGLVLLLEGDERLVHAAPALLEMVLGVVLTSVVVNEIVGPVLTRLALERAGEAGADRMRLLDFLHEENIVMGLGGATKEEVIERLVDLMIETHELEPELREPLLASALAREEESSTCLGGGLFVPHAMLPEGQRMFGVMGISDAGLPFDTPDGEPVHYVFLLATPPEERDRHLQVLAALARTIGFDRSTQTALRESKTPAHAYEVLHTGEEAEGFNYFLDAGS